MLNNISLLHSYTSNLQCVGFVVDSQPDSCSWSVGEFLVPLVEAAFPLLTLWEQGAGPVRWFSSETYVLIHCEGVCCSLPLFPSYWEVTVRLTKQRECMRNREEGGRLMGDVKGGDI